MVFLFSAHQKPGDAHKENRIIRLYRLTNAIDFYNEATMLDCGSETGNRKILFFYFCLNSVCRYGLTFSAVSVNIK